MKNKQVLKQIKALRPGDLVRVDWHDLNTKLSQDASRPREHRLYRGVSIDEAKRLIVSVFSPFQSDLPSSNEYEVFVDSELWWLFSRVQGPSVCLLLRGIFQKIRQSLSNLRQIQLIDDQTGDDPSDAEVWGARKHVRHQGNLGCSSKSHYHMFLSLSIKRLFSRRKLVYYLEQQIKRRMNQHQLDRQHNSQKRYHPTILTHWLVGDIGIKTLGGRL